MSSEHPYLQLLAGNDKANKKAAELKAIHEKYDAAMAAFSAYVMQQEALQGNAVDTATAQLLQSGQAAKSHISPAVLKKIEQEVEKVIKKLETNEYYSQNPERAANVKQVMTRALTATQNYAKDPNKENTKEFFSSRREVGRLGTIGAGVFTSMTSLALITFFVGLALTASGVGGLAGFWLMMTSIYLLTIGNGLTLAPFMMFKGKELEDRALVKNQMVNIESEAEEKAEAEEDRKSLLEA